MTLTKSQTKQFTEALETRAADYRVSLTAADLGGLSKYYELLNTWNSQLHLVAPTTARVFATRHILESLLLLEHLPESASVADVGSGAGLPIIPCLIVRPDLKTVLIEASKKKAVFLREALMQLPATKRATVIAARFEDTVAPEVGFITCRALERFEQVLPQLLEWSPAKATLLLFGGAGLQKEIEHSGFPTTAVLIPNSEKRFLFVIAKV